MSNGDNSHKSARPGVYYRVYAGDVGYALPEKKRIVMKICSYARQQCRWPDRDCPRDEELSPVFASSPELAVRKVWACQWAGSRLTLAAYMMHLVEEKKLKV